MRAVVDDDSQAAGPSDDQVRTVLGTEPSPLALLEGTATLLAMDRHEVGTPLGDLEALSPH